MTMTYTAPPALAKKIDSCFRYAVLVKDGAEADMRALQEIYDPGRTMSFLDDVALFTRLDLALNFQRRSDKAHPVPVLLLDKVAEGRYSLRAMG